MSKGGLRARLLAYLGENADENGLVREPIDTIRVKLGVSRHDIIKAVWDLKALGRVTFTEEKDGNSSYPDQIILRDARKKPGRKDHSVEVLEYIQSHGGGEGEWVPFESQPLAAYLGMTPTSIYPLLKNMRDRGQLSIRYQGSGQRARLDALRVPAWVALEQTQDDRDEIAAHLRPDHQLLDAYRAARSWASENPGNPFLAFEPIPIVEEALHIIDGGTL